MNKVTIPATSNFEAKTFEVDEVWVSITNKEMLKFVRVKDIKDGVIVFENLFTNEATRIPKNQHSGLSKSAFKDKKEIIELIFDTPQEFIG